jgi:ribosome-binding ATPase YchF (GTP1/OBG family)
MIIGGHGHTQHNTFLNNPKIEEVINAVVRLVQQSDIQALDKEDILKDVERVKELTAKEQTPDTLQRIEKRIGMVKDGIETAEKGGELLVKVMPYLVTLWQLLTSIGS